MALAAITLMAIPFSASELTIVVQGDALSAVDRAIVSTALGRNKGLFESTYGATSLQVEAVKVVGGDLLISVHGGSDSEILLFRVDRRGRSVWDVGAASVRTGRYKSGARLRPAADGGCFLSWIQAEPRGFFLRRLSPEGKELWTTKLTERNAMHHDMAEVPGGDVVVAMNDYPTIRVIRIHPDRTPGWRPGGVELATTTESHNPVSLLLVHGGQDAIIAWYRFGEERNEAIAQRVRLRDGTPLWDRPVSLGEAPQLGPAPPPRILLEEAADGAVVAHLDRGVLGDADYRPEPYTVRLTLDGKVTED